MVNFYWYEVTSNFKLLYCDGFKTRFHASRHIERDKKGRVRPVWRVYLTEVYGTSFKIGDAPTLSAAKQIALDYINGEVDNG